MSKFGMENFHERKQLFFQSGGNVEERDGRGGLHHEHHQSVVERGAQSRPGGPFHREPERRFSTAAQRLRVQPLTGGTIRPIRYGVLRDASELYLHVVF